MITIDKEFRDLIPPLTGEERDGLEQSLKAEGCRDAIVLWGDTIIDGHNRYEICQREGIPFSTVQKDFKDRNEALLWMVQNQMARRNLSAYDRTVMALRMKELIASKAKERQVANLKKGTEKPEPVKEEPIVEAKPEPVNMQETEVPAEPTAEKPVEREVAKDPEEQGPVPTKWSERENGDTREEIARIAGVGTTTVTRVEHIQRSAPAEVKEQLQRGEISINKAYNAVKKMEKEKQVQEAKDAIAEQTRENPDAPRIQVGDSIGWHPDAPFDLLLTDPPYSTDVDDVDTFARKWLPDALSTVKPSGFAYVFIGAYPDELKAYLNTPIPEHMHLEQVLVWTYKNTLGNNPKDRYKLNWQACLFYRGSDAPPLDCPLTSEQWAVQEINAPDGRQGDRYHTWQKPMEIAERFIRHSTKPGMRVYDPFACTGTFLLAAAKLGREAFGFEIDPENAKIAVERGCAYA